MSYISSDLAIERFIHPIDYVDSKLEDVSRTWLILATTITLVTLYIFVQLLNKPWGIARREQIGRKLLKTPFIRKRYDAKIQEEYDKFRESVKNIRRQFGPIYHSIPCQGLKTEALLQLVRKYSDVTFNKVKDKQLSGTIYSKSLVKKNAESQIKHEEFKFDDLEEIGSDSDYFEALSEKLELLFCEAFKQAYLWNSLHRHEFAIGSFLEHQVVQMAANMFGASVEIDEVDNVMGFVTSGGTESLMLAVRIYREWGAVNKGHQPGESVIIASKSVHAAIEKGCQAYQVKLVLLETAEDGKTDVELLKKTIKQYGSKVVAIIGSAPSYIAGVMDPIEEMAAVAFEYGIGFHVDCCLGGFIVNNLKHLKTDFCKEKGVTSLSADTHKNGLAPKGSSVLLTMMLGDENLAKYAIYVIPGWSGGVYGTPKDAGSQSCVPALMAFLALLATGQSGYKRLAQSIYKSACEVADFILGCKGRLKLIAYPQANVVAFKIDPQWGLQKGAIYAFAHEMAQHGVVLNAMAKEKVHFCITARFSGDPNGLHLFKQAVNSSLKNVEKLNEQLLKEGKKFPGDAGMYCSLEAALAPRRETLSFAKYIENMMLGVLGAKDAIRAYYLADLAP